MGTKINVTFDMIQESHTIDIPVVEGCCVPWLT